MEIEVDDEITVTVKDAEGKTYSENWKRADDNRDAVRWTLESGDLPHYVNVGEIVEITIK